MNETVRLKGRKVYHRVTTSWGRITTSWERTVVTRETACGVWGGPERLQNYSPDSNEGLKPCRKCFPGGVDE